MKKNIKNLVLELFEGIKTKRMQYSPSKYAERYRTLTSDVSSVQGKFKYDMTPYLREIVDTLSPYHPAKITAIIKGAQIGFALDLNTKIPTTYGWTTMGKIKVGDKIFDEKGNVCNVTFATDVMYNRQCFNVFFSDGTKIIADADHKWAVTDEKNYDYKKEKIINTLEISKTFKHRKNRNRYAINNAKPLILEEKNLPINPYVLGYWLGDGNRTSNRIVCDNNIVEEITSYFKEFGERAEKLNIYKNKHIPDIYLRASIQQRLELLQGLMDSDGSITKSGGCEFYNTDKKLIEQVYELIASFGYKPVLKKKSEPGTCEIIKGKIYKTKSLYRITFKAFKEFPVFKLKKKFNRLPLRKNTRFSEIERRRIVNVEKCESVPVRCISVDSESHLYLAGKNMIPTHNTEGVLVNGILWIIANNPGNIMSLAANDDLSKEMIESRLDQGIESCGITDLIRPNTIRKRNQRTGDTSKYKEFAGGRLFAGGLNSIDKIGRQRSIKFGFFDDWDVAVISDKKQGNIYELLQQRFSTNAQGMKQYFISTPQNRPSNIEQVYLKGDQRKWHVPCPLCGKYTEIIWQSNDRKSGIVYKKDSDGRLIENSVGYQCPECGGIWKEKHKYKVNLKGKWIATQKPDRPGMYSYHINCLTAAPNMYDWTHYVRQYLDCFNAQGKIIQSKLKVFKNVVLGEVWEEKKTTIKKNQLAQNIRNYDINIVPHELSNLDGNGDIILLTCSCDLNGTLDDARLDWEVVGHSESGSVYSINHGSIGTYKSDRRKEDPKRKKFTYRNNEPENVWDLYYNEVINIDYPTENNDSMRIMMTAVDTGYYTHYAYDFIDSYPGQVVGVKGEVKKSMQKVGIDIPKFKPARERPNLYILAVELLKDELADMISLKWSEKSEQPQPSGFINFPMPNYKFKKYDNNYFVQYEAEEKKIETDDDGEPIGWKWVRRHSSAPNHFFDCAVYNLALRKIISKNIMKELGKRHSTWTEFVGVVKGMM